MVTEQLLANLTTKSELLASRRLRRAGMAYGDALAQVLTGGQPERLPAVVEQRLQRRAEQAAAQAAARASRTARHATAARRHAQRHAVPAQTWRAQFDGSAHPNPGRIGIGAVLYAPQAPGAELASPVWQLSRAAGHGDCSAAEYLALIALLEQAVLLRASPLHVSGDSRVVLDDVRDGASAVLAPLRARAAALLRQLDDVTLAWVPRARNTTADALSQAAIST
ncbi:MAG TPA: reverse transcriptase-like protein [Burkholderiaceae bacterium]